MRLVYELLTWAVFLGVIGLLSVWPRYEMVDADQAIVTVTFSHAAQRVGECRILTQEELNKLPPNMRKPADCPRERHPVRLELRSGDDVLYADVLAPSGIWSDGKANVYRRVLVAAGTHALFVGMNDSGTDDGFDFESTATLNVSPGRNVVIRFEQDAGQFTIR